MKRLIAIIALGSIITSCVPARKYQELKAKSAQCEEDLAALKQKSLTYEAELAERQAELDRLTKEYKILKGDKELIEKSLAQKEKEYDKLNHLYTEVEKKYEKLIAGSESE